MMDDRQRCPWALNSATERDYHDREWGVPVTEDRRLFELLVLEGAQAGLSWRTILNKRTHYREAFDDFDATSVARYSAEKIDRLVQDARIVRNRLKIEAAVANARRFLEVQQEYVSFYAYLWQFTGGQGVQNRWRTPSQIPVSTPASDAMSKDLKRRGFKFVGTTICYAYMQSVGMVNDHLVSCFRHREIRRLTSGT
jgi:DNA-3-methyladenine glycosylase I